MPLGQKSASRRSQSPQQVLDYSRTIESQRQGLAHLLSPQDIILHINADVGISGSG